MDLFHASRDVNIKLMKELIRHGANVNAREDKGWTPLMCASCHINGNIEIVKILIEAGANVNARDGEGWTPLMIASHFGQIEIIRVLLESGADINSIRDNKTILSTASFEGHIDVVKVLLESGADVNSCCGCALVWAVIKNHKKIVLLLLENGANPYIICNNYLNAFSHAYKYDHKEIIKILNNHMVNDLKFLWPFVSRDIIIYIIFYFI